LYAVIISPYVMPAAPFALIALLWGRRWILAALSAFLCAALVITHLPYYVAAEPNSNSVRVRVMTLNMRFGGADPRQIVYIASQRADVLMLQELTPEGVQALSGAGIDSIFPHRALDPRVATPGVGVYSRFPTTTAGKVGGIKMSLFGMRIRVAGARDDVSVVSAHLTAPWPQPIENWNRELSTFPRALEQLATDAGAGAVIVGGDFNSTIEMRPFRRILGNEGFGDASEQAGAGRIPTYPSNRRFPALIAIDHVVTWSATATSVKSVDIEWTDHRALIADIDVPG
jgi:endonuclease/exonuclease/phosphatase (EEP) superfamily protein YafD